MKKRLQFILGITFCLLFISFPANACRFNSLELTADCEEGYTITFTITGEICADWSYHYGDYLILYDLSFNIGGDITTVSGNSTLTVLDNETYCVPFVISDTLEKCGIGEIEGTIKWQKSPSMKSEDNETLGPIYFECPCPSVITLSSFTAEPGRSSVTLSWETGSEEDNEGFNIYRSESEDGEYDIINSSMIPAKGSYYGGTSYEFVDDDVRNRKKYYYILEDIDINGKTTPHGPISATPLWMYGLFR